MRLFIRFDLQPLLESVMTGAVDVDELLSQQLIDRALVEVSFLDSDDLADLFGQVWLLSAVESHLFTGTPILPVSLWAEKKRIEQDEKIKTFLASERDSDLAKLLIFCASGMDLPARVMSLLLKSSGTEDKELSHLVWLKGWMEFMSRRGSKVTFRNNRPLDDELSSGRDMPFPEESRQQAVSNLARVETAIRKRVTELSR